MGIKTKIENYIKTWEQRCYPNGIPDAAPIELESKGLVPSYRRICLAILKNDPTLKSIDFNPPKSKYYSDLKRIEISQRKQSVIQLKLF
jgi:predicted phosphoadenosine phosphosulfate sulfurtransferase